MRTTRAGNVLLYGGIDRCDFDSIRPMIWRRNVGVLRFTAAFAAIIGAIFIAINYFLHSNNQLPYLFLLCGSVLMLCLMALARKKKEPRELWSLLMCYGQMLLIFGYATYLSTQPANYDIPATSAIVFLALLPLSIDDRPIRMFAVMLGESILYLLLSHRLKSPHAFSLDLMNIATFGVMGMVLYAVICMRNIRELYQSGRIEKMSFQTIQTLANAIDAKDPYTKGHSTRVSQYAVKIAERLGWNPARITDLRYAALLHDIGKVGVPDSILNKPAGLTDVEYDIIKSHTTMGGEILRGGTIVDIAEDVATSHHERYDGRGYPNGLSGREISEEARLVGIADAFDAMNSSRVYRKACDREYILQQLTQGRGEQFDPEYADILIDLWNQGQLEESLKGTYGSEDRGGTIASLHKAVESFVTENSSEELVEDIKNSGSYEGALNVEYNQFTRLYEFMVNLKKRFNHPFELILITLEENPGQVSTPHDLTKAMFYLERAIRISIRDVDIVTQYNRKQFLVIMLGTEQAGIRIAVDRIFKCYFRMNGSNIYSPSYTVIEAKQV